MKRPVRTFFTADQHFGHHAVIGMCNRPFATVDEMDRSMIEQWNAAVALDDIVYHLGDFSHKAKHDRVRGIFAALHGRKHLIIGNHDRQPTLQQPWVEAVQMGGVVVDGIRIVMCHYGLRVWPGMHRGAIMLYGHSHGRLPGSRTTLDVGVDAVGYAPIDLPTIQARMAALPMPAYDEGRPVDEPGDALTV